MSGMIVERRDQVLMTLFSFRPFRSSTLRSRWPSTKGPFLRLRGIVLPPGAATTAAADNQAVGRAVRTAGTAFWLAPGRNGVPATGRLAFATTERVVHRVHGDATGLRAHTLPAVAACFTDLYELGLGV